MLSKNKPKIYLQKDATDCGPACLLSLINHYEGQSTLETLRKQSGTTIEGTTLLGLYEAASENGFDAEGCEADIEALKAHGAPVILHVKQQNQMNHYVICFGMQLNKNRDIFIIGDPGSGIAYLTEQELESMWQSKFCLTLKPNNSFKNKKNIKALKRQWIHNMLQPDFSILTVTAILGVAIAILSLSLAFFSQRLIDDILPKRDNTKLVFGTILIFIILLAKELLSAIRQYFTVHQSKSFNTRVIDFFYSKLLLLPKPFFDTRKIGELTARLNDTARIQKVINQLIGNTVIDILLIPATITFLLSYSPLIGLVCLSAMPVFFIIVYVFSKKIVDGQKAVMKGYADTEANYISTLQGIEPIKNFQQQFNFSEINKTIYQGFQNTVYKLGRKQISMSFITNSFGALFIVAVLFFGGYQVLHQQLKIGELVAVLTMSGTLLPSVANLAMVTVPLTEAMIAFDRMTEFTGFEPEGRIEECQSVEGFESLSADNISFKYPGRSLLLTDISFSVVKGEIIAIMGENGSGKSTLAQIIQKNYQPKSGRMLVNGTFNLSTTPLESWRGLYATVPQQVHIFNGTVLENISFRNPLEDSRDVLQFLELNGFMPYLNTLPQSLMTLVGEEGINLSGGQKQIIAFARALYHKPGLLILDEATAAMDRDSELFVINLLKRLKHEMAVIFITHRLHVLKYLCDKIYILENGCITYSGNHTTLLQSSNLYSKYWADMVV